MQAQSLVKIIPGQEAQSSDIQEIVKTDVANSPYYKKIDVFNLTNTNSRIILSRFATRQQKTNYTCAPVAAMMVADYYLGTCPYDEIATAKIMGTNKLNGTNVNGVKKFFEQLDWNITDSHSTPAPKNYPSFTSWVKKNLLAKRPIIVENVEWGGHWRVIIGFDDMGTPVEDDDVLFFADPFDSTDHIRDGYTVGSAKRFFYMWFDAKLFNGSDKERPYLIASPK